MAARRRCRRGAAAAVAALVVAAERHLRARWTLGRFRGRRALRTHPFRDRRSAETLCGASKAWGGLRRVGAWLVFAGMSGRGASPWNGKSPFLAVICGAAIAANAWSWWPFGATLWVAALSAVLLWPDDEQFDAGTKAQSAAAAAHEMRGPLRGGGAVWRLGAAPGCELQYERNPPPARLTPLSFSAVAAALVAAAALLVDLGVGYAASHPLMPRLVLPGYGIDSAVRHVALTAPLSALFGWWVAQAVAFGRRQVMYRDEEMTTPPAAEFLNGLRAFAASVLDGSALCDPEDPDDIAAGRVANIARLAWPWLAALFVGGLAWYFPVAAEWVGWGTIIGLLVVGAIAGTLAQPLRCLARWQHNTWHAIQEEEQQWVLRWVGAKGLSLDETRVPKLYQIEDYPTPGEGEEAKEPKFRTLLFQLRSGTQFGDIAHSAKQMASSLGRQRVVIERFRHPDSDEHLQAFQLSHELVDLGPSPHLNPRLDATTLDFVVRWAVISAMRDLKMATPVCIKVEALTVGGPLIVSSSWQLSDGLTFADVAAKAGKMQEILGCDWFRPFIPDGYNYLGLVFGARPTEVQFKRPQDVLKRQLESIDWSFQMREVGLIGSDLRAPQLQGLTEAPLGLKEMIFRYPPAVESKDVQMVIGKLRNASGHGHIEMSEDPKEPGQFKLLVGDSDPLAGMYPFSRYHDEILHQPSPGHPRTDWMVGMQATGQLLRYEWDGEEPHLLIAGSSGGGKSGIINSMLCQLMHNNDPDDVKIWLVEPKNEMQVFKNCAHVTRFLDAQSTSDTPHAAFAALMSEAIEEMQKRYTAFAQHPAAPQKLEEARALAVKDPEGAGHLNFPYTFIVVEECANYFCQPLPQDKDAYALIMSYIQKLARESRAAGIYLLVATQYPTKQNIPMTLKQQCRRIGLPVASSVASLVIIDQVGLEKIKGPGRGMMASGSKLVGFRGLLLMRGEENGVQCDERADMVAGLPANENWPKLPAGVNPGQLVKIVGDSLEAAPAVPPRVAGRLAAAPETGRASQRADEAREPAGRARQTDANTWLDEDSWLDDTARSDRPAADRDPEWVPAGDVVDIGGDGDEVGVAAVGDPEWVPAGDVVDIGGDGDEVGVAAVGDPEWVPAGDVVDIGGDGDEVGVAAVGDPEWVPAGDVVDIGGDGDEVGVAAVGDPEWVPAGDVVDIGGDGDEVGVAAVGDPEWVPAGDVVDIGGDGDEVGVAAVGDPEWVPAGDVVDIGGDGDEVGDPAVRSLPGGSRARHGALGAPRPHNEREHRNRRLVAQARAVAHALSP